MAGTMATKSTTARGKKSNLLVQPSTASNSNSLQQSMLTRYIYETRSSELPISERLHQKANTAASSKATNGLLRLDI
ncbi:hypothetical protein TMEN_8601 [Trichophyton mentagrophytes]|uniref:Uncharacterized protein n=1 Tax=Trichophyton interdigitale (strain MR816) TaxID=1215338 RepID=A0A059J159_TRIIM|nr:hypothetical protein GY631_2076 [Trichophyton interdigitale]KAG5218844.1 hypothetical protein GY632_5145 [Trichophyton interdigitale]KAG8207132.1 hypothetical protein GTR04_5492 [Trichophyton interdigitale]KDB21519.1 hypothetical protein H109_06550 [Trichophyton interdigitale MR816]GBF65883.1 hypothetical protein TMEN_8601 [Trichophyton mentagrophytes]